MHIKKEAVFLLTGLEIAGRMTFLQVLLPQTANVVNSCSFQPSCKDMSTKMYRMMFHDYCVYQNRNKCIHNVIVLPIKDFPGYRICFTSVIK